MALSQRESILIANLARRGDSFARNILFQSTQRDQMLMESLAKRGDAMALRHVKGTNAPIPARALVNRLARAGEAICAGLNSITTDKLAQVITFAQPAQIDIVGPDTEATVALVATSDSGLPVTFVLVSGTATLDGANLTVDTAGDVVIEAQQLGDPNHAAATPVQRTITVTVTP